MCLTSTESTNIFENTTFAGCCHSLHDNIFLITSLFTIVLLLTALYILLHCNPTAAAVLLTAAEKQLLLETPVTRPRGCGGHSVKTDTQITTQAQQHSNI